MRPFLHPPRRRRNDDTLDGIELGCLVILIGLVAMALAYGWLIGTVIQW